MITADALICLVICSLVLQAVVVHIDETNLFHFNQAKFGRLKA